MNPTGTQTPAPRLGLLEKMGPEACEIADKKKTLVIIPFSPVEYHGNHLPLSTDLVLAENFSRAAAETFLASHGEWHALVHPVVPIGADCVPHPGSVAVPSRTIERVAANLSCHFIKQGFPNIALMSGHGGFSHAGALERAARKLTRKYQKQGVRVIAPLGPVMFNLWNGGIRETLNPLLQNKITPEEEKNFIYEIHGGWWETSMVLAHQPGRMTDAYRQTPDYLPAVKTWVRFAAGFLVRILPRRYGARVAASRNLMQVAISWFLGDTSAGYLGFPSRATPEMGRASTQLAGRVFSDFFHRMFVERADLEEAQSIYSLPDLLRWYGLGACALVLLVLALVLLF